MSKGEGGGGVRRTLSWTILCNKIRILAKCEKSAAKKKKEIVSGRLFLLYSAAHRDAQRTDT